jgi:hypothetical protein
MLKTLKTRTFEPGLVSITTVIIPKNQRALIITFSSSDIYCLGAFLAAFPTVVAGIDLARVLDAGGG